MQPEQSSALVVPSGSPWVEQRQRLFDGERFVVSGALERWSRDEIGAMLEGAGARVTSAVSKQTDYVVVGGKPGSKARKAEELGVPVLDEQALVELLRDKGLAVD
jgi:DNA ligase (NAD+)